MSGTKLLDDPAFRVIVDRFVSEIPNRIASLSDAIAEEAFADAQRFAHQLKGAGGSFGFPAITAAAAQVEMSCAARDADGNLADEVQHLSEVCDQVVEEWSAKPALT